MNYPNLCPVCEKSHSVELMSRSGQAYFVRCTSCGINSNEGTDAEDAIRIWNTVSTEWAAKVDAKIKQLDSRPDQEPWSRKAARQAALNLVATRRELAEKILLKLIEIASERFQLEHESGAVTGGVDLAWSIADAFLKAEGTQ